MPPAKPPDERPIALNFTPSGKVRTIYKDELVPLYESLGKVSVHRASNVEWEEIDEPRLHPAVPGKRCGWTVRAAHDPALALRFNLTWGCETVVSRDEHFPVIAYKTREAALEAEVEHFWALLPPEK